MPSVPPESLRDAPIALICAAPLELEPLLGAMHPADRIVIGRRDVAAGLLDGTPALALAGGLGKANAAQALTALLERRAVRGVLNFGVAGAYPGSGLRVGDVALATCEIYGDEGVATPDGWVPTEAIGIPLLEQDGRRRFNEFPLEAGRVAAAAAALAAAGVDARSGAFLTVSCCSGTARRGAELAARFAALCESMEGAALAHVAEHYAVPFLEVRAVSNAVEDRDTSRWRLQDAAAAAARAARVLVRLF